LGAAELVIEPLGRLAFRLPSISYRANARSSAGDFYFLSAQRIAIHRVSAVSSEVREIPLPEVVRAAATAGSRLTLPQDLSVDRSGYVYVPAIWREAPSRNLFGVFVYDPQGSYSRTIVLSPPAEIRHVAVDESGNLFVLGIDAKYFKGEVQQCFLVHKYSPAGRRLASLSPCPSGLDLRQPSGHTGPGFRTLTQDVDRGRVWVQGGQVYHLLAYFRRVRLFSLDGKLLGEADLQPPGGLGAAADTVWRIVLLSGGRFLVDWLHPQQSGGSAHNTRYLCLHDTQGRALSGATPEPWQPSLLAFGDDAGTSCYFLRGLSDGSEELIRTKVTLRCRDHLPNSQVLELATVCGHGMVSFRRKRCLTWCARAAAPLMPLRSPSPVSALAAFTTPSAPNACSKKPAPTSARASCRQSAR
jgi:hypothetical protein